jgi:hypothetical protein
MSCVIYSDHCGHSDTVTDWDSKTSEYTVKLSYNVVIGTYNCAIINECCYTEEYDVMVNSEELIRTTEPDAIDEVSYKLISL